MTNDLVNYDAKLAAYAAKQAENTRGGGSKVLSTRGGVLSYEDVELPGSQMVALVLDDVHANTFYKGKYDPESPAAPTCYAYGRLKGADMAPHESMAEHLDYFEPQAESCAVCPQNVFGTADVGRGKACKNRERLALIPAGYYVARKGSRDFDLEMFDKPAAFADTEIVHLNLPPTSVVFWNKYKAMVRAAHSRPTWAVVTRIWLEKDPKDQYHVRFEMLELLPNEAIDTVEKRVLEAEASIITPYSPPEAQAAPPVGGLRGLRR